MGYTRDDYTVAWICALPLEMAAAKLMLDKVHPSLPKPNTDHNTYTLGSVGGHNVVVACLPSGVYGTTAAAVVLAHMLQTYPSLRFALMVGIGGGVPSKTADIRLGDVVVSMPTNASGGVVQYDYGKTLRNGNLQRTGSLNKPPQYLLTAVSQVRSEPEISLEKVVTEMLQKQEGIQKQFSRPSKDLLFEATYDHKSEDSDCSACDRTQIVNRKPRESGEPRIHYGLIASGNQVMKNAQIRDSIAQPTGVLCFEMEAAGLMDQISCLVIRGICDYCDSHKHKDWQGYAALTAAAYAAHLLQTVPVTENISPRAQSMYPPKFTQSLITNRDRSGVYRRTEGMLAQPFHH
jgi:nucleoside phosphorylase